MKLPTFLSFAALCCSSPVQADPVFVVIHADIKPSYTAEGTRLLQDFAEKTRKDKSSGMFEILQYTDRPNHVTLIGEWENKEAYDRHVSAPETAQWRASLQPMLGSPFDERLHKELP